ncbi:MAG: hypothetical protein L6R45_04830 [Anaerolineae bacterium]|nr:hypothetical protein [Anaerolineae bacterium]
MPKVKTLLNLKPSAMPEHPPCAFCGSKQTEFVALFGQFLLVSQYYCRNCHSAFEWCKWQAEEENMKRDA